MRHLLILAPLLLPVAADAGSEVTIQLSPRAAAIERFAAVELSDHLHLLYPGIRFSIRDRSKKGATVLLGTPSTFPELAEYLGSHKLDLPESFAIATVRAVRTPTAIVAGADPRATLFAVYALLEKLGFGFYLSYTANPPPRREPFTFDGWDLADRPLTPVRTVFNWHNFLSGCSTWDLRDWQNWVAQAARMRFNHIMVHAYGNNPMFSFTHNGLAKPTGYLTTTARGRDWGTEHVLDVRRILGGTALFDGPVFGSSAGLVPENETVSAATALMQKVFQFAAARGLGVTFALDVDTATANPQNIIATLPASARFTVHGVELVNPETAAGRVYYRSQIEQLLERYPQITQIAIWFRGGRNSPWREITRQQFPPSWQPEYDRTLAAQPGLRADPEAPSMFAIGKIAHVFRAILDESGHPDVTLAAGSWRFEFVPAADAFLPRSVALTPLDYAYAFATDPVQTTIRAAAAHRPVIPIVWAQHDDHSFAGRPYAPFAGFASLLDRSASAGFGIIHWTTRPCDLYFKSLADQVWAGGRNEPIETTCSRMAERTFGSTARESGGRYLLSWILDAPMFGRETSDRFIDRAIDEAPVLEGCRRRLQLLEPIGATVQYFQEWERFVSEFYRAQAALQRSTAALQHGNLAQARLEIAHSSPEAAIAQYARTIASGATPGEKGILISLNLRWLPWFIYQRQTLGIEPLRIRFAPTAPDPLAQSPGKYTFDFDTAGHLWQVLGSSETGAEVSPAGLRVNRPVALSVKPAAGRLLGGDWRLQLDLAAGQSVEVRGSGTHRLDTTHNTIDVLVERESLDIQLRPVDSAAVVSRLVLTPKHSP